MYSPVLSAQQEKENSTTQTMLKSIVVFDVQIKLKMFYSKKQTSIISSVSPKKKTMRQPITDQTCSYKMVAV